MIKKTAYLLVMILIVIGCKPLQDKSESAKQITVFMDLNTAKDNKILVSVNPPSIKTEKVAYYMPKIIPGTYSEDDFGRYVENVKAFDKKQKPLPVSKIDHNTWIIENAKALAKLTYYVNGTFHTEHSDNNVVFSPAGTNIKQDENFLINTHGFIGYFKEESQSMTNELRSFIDYPYVININHLATLYGSTSMEDKDTSDIKDTFVTTRYAELVDHPIMYSKPNQTHFDIQGMEVLISVYSPNNIYTAESITEEMKKMITAQKNFLGDFNKTPKYSILLYLADVTKEDAKGFGALEHNTSTTVVLPEQMPKEQLLESLVDVVSHEFFHTVTPLNIHSKEIQYFDFNSPKMSQHLWLYEGVTEYFANLFQINQELISEEEFYSRILEKIESSRQYRDNVSFIEMSKNILQSPYKDDYYNVYLKGALIAMCLDIQLRELSHGKEGILDVLKKLAIEYDSEKPFDDNELFDKITALTYPEIGEFLQKHVVRGTPIPYDYYLAKVGVHKITIKVPENVFVKHDSAQITVNPENNQISIPKEIELNGFMKAIGVQGGDILLEVNNIAYDLHNVYDLIMLGIQFKDDQIVTFKVKRDDKELILKGKVENEKVDVQILRAADKNKEQLKNAWLKG